MKDHLAKTVHLARLRFKDKDLDRLLAKMEHILKYVETLNTLPTDSLEPTSHAINIVNAFREDKVLPFEKPKPLTALSPDPMESWFQVPKVIDEEA